MHRTFHVDTLILNPTLKIYMFWYSGWTDGQTERWTEKIIRSGLGKLLVPPGRWWN
jgi:hypothetical protein